MKNELLPNDYKDTLELIIQKIELAQQKAVISANITLLDLYWEIGNILLHKKKEQGWGAKVIENLSKDITSAFPGVKGYSCRNLEYMSQFAKIYSNYLDLKDELSKVSWSHNLVLMSKVKDEYALKDINKPIGISEYELIKAIPEDLKSNLPTIEEIEQEITEKIKNNDNN